MKLSDKQCIIIEFNISDGSEPVVIMDGLNYKGEDWWEANNHHRKGMVAEVEHNVECGDGKRTMSTMAISFPNKIDCGAMPDNEKENEF
jgi:hypothetical protein